jgi:ABC-type lipoprotein export system ATPase subunit
MSKNMRPKEVTASKVVHAVSGVAQRVAIARALANHPKIVLADEPTGNLDEENAREVARLLVHSCKEWGATLVLATHDIRSFEGVDRVFALQAGLLKEKQFRSV